MFNFIKPPTKTPFAAALILVVFLAIFTPGCITLPGVKPFKLDITIDFKNESAQIIGTDQQGQVVLNQTFTKEQS